MNAINFSSINEVLDYTNNKNDKGFVIFSSKNNIIKLSSAISDNVILCSTSGEYSSFGYIDGGFTGFEYDPLDAEVVEILCPPIKSLSALKSAYNKVQANSNAFALLLCDGLTGMEETIITTFFFAREDFKIIGGSAGDNLEFKETSIYIGRKKVHSIAIFFNSKKKTHLIKENIYTPTNKRMLITDADITGRIVKTFNGKPASQEYARVLGVREAELSNYFMNNPLGKYSKEDVYISSPMKVNDDKSITFYCQMIPNTFVQILDPIDPISQLNNTLKVAAAFNPSFVLAINCILRSLKFQQESIWPSFDRKLLAFCKNTTGFISYGEQFYKNHVNQTMVMMIVE